MKYCLRVKTLKTWRRCEIWKYRKKYYKIGICTRGN